MKNSGGMESFSIVKSFSLEITAMNTVAETAISKACGLSEAMNFIVLDWRKLKQPKMVACPVCTSEYSTALSMCPTCEGNRVKEYVQKEADELLELSKAQIDPVFSELDEKRRTEKEKISMLLATDSGVKASWLAVLAKWDKTTRIETVFNTPEYRELYRFLFETHQFRLGYSDFMHFSNSFGGNAGGLDSVQSSSSGE